MYDSAPVYSEFYFCICHRRKLARTSSSSSTKLQKGDEQSYFLFLQNNRACLREYVTRPVTAAYLNIQTAFSYWNRELKGCKKKAWQQIIQKSSTLGFWRNCIVFLQQICIPNYALLKLILKWVCIPRESTHQLGKEKRGSKDLLSDGLGAVGRSAAWDWMFATIIKDSLWGSSQFPQIHYRDTAWELYFIYYH